MFHRAVTYICNRYLQIIFIVYRLKELQELKTGLQALNKQSDSEYAAIAPEFLKAARLAALVKADLNEISKRLQ